MSIHRGIIDLFFFAHTKQHRSLVQLVESTGFVCKIKAKKLEEKGIRAPGGAVRDRGA
jgi:hypothetical protein